METAAAPCLASLQMGPHREGNLEGVYPQDIVLLQRWKAPGLRLDSHRHQQGRLGKHEGAWAARVAPAQSPRELETARARCRGSRDLKSSP